MDDDETKDRESDPPEMVEMQTKERTMSDRKGDASQSMKTKKKEKKQKKARSKEIDVVEETAYISESQKQDTRRPVDHPIAQEAQEDSDSEQDSEPDDASKYVDYARGEGLMSSSSDEEDFGLPIVDDDEV